jgi:hypothetical protein
LKSDATMVDVRSGPWAAQHDELHWGSKPLEDGTA